MWQTQCIKQLKQVVNISFSSHALELLLASHPSQENIFVYLHLLTMCLLTTQPCQNITHSSSLNFISLLCIYKTYLYISQCVQIYCRTSWMKIVKFSRRRQSKTRRPSRRHTNLLRLFPPSPTCYFLAPNLISVRNTASLVPEFGVNLSPRVVG